MPASKYPYDTHINRKLQACPITQATEDGKAPRLFRLSKIEGYSPAFTSNRTNKLTAIVFRDEAIIKARYWH